MVKSDFLKSPKPAGFKPMALKSAPIPPTEPFSPAALPVDSGLIVVYLKASDVN